MNAKYTAILEREKHGYYAYCPELKGCHTQGETVEEALDNLREAAELYLETLTAKERSALSSRSILTTSLELSHA